MVHPYIKNIQFEVTAPLDYVPQTDTPRELTFAEVSILRGLTRLKAIKQHREWTGSTLAAAIRCVDAAHAA